jgi:hypothetical protein
MTESYQHSDSFLLIRNRKLEIDNKNLSTTPNWKSKKRSDVEYNSTPTGGKMANNPLVTQRYNICFNLTSFLAGNYSSHCSQVVSEFKAEIGGGEGLFNKIMEAVSNILRSNSQKCKFVEARTELTINNKNMNLQYISDSNGQTTGVFIPINEWNKLKNKHKDIEQEEVSVPEWHKNLVLKRLEDYKQNPDSAIDFDSAIEDIEREL